MIHKVLLVSSHPIVQDFLLNELQQNGYEVDFADTSARAISNRENKNYDVVLCDCCMPKIDGLALAANMSEMELQTPMVVMSSENIAQQYQQQNNVVGFVDKTQQNYVATAVNSLRLALANPEYRVENAVVMSGATPKVQRQGQ